jgi:ribonucleotide monophosphatase NagD (HAD superfamily)
VKYGSVSGTITSGNITVTIISRHSKTIYKLVEEQMKKEAQELGFDPWGDSAQEEYER